MIRIKDIKIREDLLEEKVLEKALQKNRLQKEDVKKWYIYKKSIDARKKEDIFHLESRKNLVIRLKIPLTHPDKPLRRQNSGEGCRKSRWRDPQTVPNEEDAP